MLARDTKLLQRQPVFLFGRCPLERHCQTDACDHAYLQAEEVPRAASTPQMQLAAGAPATFLGNDQRAYARRCDPSLLQQEQHLLSLLTLPPAEVVQKILLAQALRLEPSMAKWQQGAPWLVVELWQAQPAEQGRTGSFRPNT